MGSSAGNEVTKKAMWMYPKVLDFNPPERWGHSACYTQGFIYVFGGCCGGLHFSDVITLNLNTMSWATLSTTGPGPGPRDSHSAVLFRRKMIIFGGTSGPKKVNELHILDLDSKTWARPICKGAPPSPRESHSATLVGDDELVIFGGSGEGDGNYLNDLHILDLKLMAWHSPVVKGNVPVPRDSHSAVAIGRKIFVYGGDCGDRYEGDIDVFDMDTLTWSMIVVRGSSPGVRAGHASVSLGPKVYVVGGVGDKQYYNDVWVFDINTCLWTQLEVRGQQPHGRFSHTAIVAETDVIIFGGCGEDDHPVNELLVLQLGDEHPNGRYNISLCKIFGKHFNSERKNPKREFGNCSKNILIGKNERVVKDDREISQLNSDVLQSKRKRASNPKTLVIDSEPEEHSHSLSQQSSPSQSDQELTPIKKAQSNDSWITQKNVKSFIPSSPQDFNFFKRDLNKTYVGKNVRMFHGGPCKAQCHSTEQVPINVAPSYNMVGTEIRGKVDGCFDSGYLMTATVNGKVFRGVLFPSGSEVVSRGNTMTQNISPLTNVALPTVRTVTSTQYLRESGLAQTRRASPIIRSSSSNGSEQKEKGDLTGVFLTLGGPGS